MNNNLIMDIINNKDMGNNLIMGDNKDIKEIIKDMDKIKDIIK